MRHLTILFTVLYIGQLGCAGCDGSSDRPDSLGDRAGGTSPIRTSMFDASGDDTGIDASNSSASDVGVPDMGENTADASVSADDGVDSGASDATIAVCGDGNVTSPELCDDANAADGDYCSADCGSVTGSCGDGLEQSNEVCDDGNTDDGDYCKGSCDQITGSCGDGVLQGDEACDDGSTNDCAGTHDGGDGSCVAASQCAAGHVLVQGSCIQNPTGLPEPCQNGTGFTLFRYHYSGSSTSAQIDIWDANCSYSFAPNSACNVYEICPGFCDPDVTSEGYPVFDTSDYMRVRFDVNGLNFSQATLHVQARSYATSSSTNFRVWSPLYGETFGGPVDNDFVYDWYAVDWSNFLSPSDSPNLTAIQLYGANGRVAVKAVELCVQ